MGPLKLRKGIEAVDDGQVVAFRDNCEGEQDRPPDGLDLQGQRSADSQLMFGLDAGFSAVHDTGSAYTETRYRGGRVLDIRIRTC